MSPCKIVSGAIICSSNRRRFTYKGKEFFVEEGGWGRGISDENGDEVIWEDFKGKKYKKFLSEIEKGINNG